MEKIRDWQGVKEMWARLQRAYEQNAGGSIE